MTDNTPLNADDELESIKRDLSESIKSHALSDPRQWLDRTNTGFMLAAEHFVTRVQAYQYRQERADRKKHELQARIDELETLNFHRSYGKDYQYTLDELEEKNDKRIAELKQELEKL